MTQLANIALRLALVLAMALPVAPAATAQELTPDHLDLARRYVELTDKGQVYETTLIETGIRTMRTIASQNPEITQEVSDAIGIVIEDYADEKTELFDKFARVYALRFTEEELREIVAFYESDLGQKLVAQNAEANQDLQNVMQVFQNNLNTEFFARVRAELRDQGLDL